MNVALILAGGLGSRSGESIPKQFVLVNNKPIIIYTLEVFQNCQEIDKIFVACLEGWQDYLREESFKHGISKLQNITTGGRTGLDSVSKSIKIMDSLSDDDLILIHDAVRPFIDVESIKNNINVANKYGVALTTTDLVETLVFSEDGCSSSKVISRNNLKRVLTPQTFRLGILRDLYKDTELDADLYPSTFALYMKKGLPIYCSKGSEKNIKLTYPEDIEYFQKMFE